MIVYFLTVKETVLWEHSSPHLSQVIRRWCFDKKKNRKINWGPLWRIIWKVKQLIFAKYSTLSKGNVSESCVLFLSGHIFWPWWNEEKEFLSSTVSKPCIPICPGACIQSYIVENVRSDKSQQSQVKPQGLSDSEGPSVWSVFATYEFKHKYSQFAFAALQNQVLILNLKIHFY